MHKNKRRISRLHGWLALGLAAYCFVSVIDDWRKRSWQETPALEISPIPSTTRAQVVKDSLGRPRTQWIETSPGVGYRYRVEGENYWGSWNGSAQPLEPPVVLYHPERPGESTLKTPPAAPVVHGLGWASLAFALLTFGWPPRERGEHEVTLPTRRERTIFRILVLADIAVLLVCQVIETPADRVPLELWIQLDALFPPGPLQEMFFDLYPVALLLTLVADFGLLGFWRPARQLYLATWCWWLAWSWFGEATIELGLAAFLYQLIALLGGAVLALSFFGPISTAFTARRRPDAGAGVEGEPVLEEKQS